MTLPHHHFDIPSCLGKSKPHISGLPGPMCLVTDLIDNIITRATRDQVPEG